MACEEPQIKKLKLSTLSDHVYSPEFQSALSDHWRTNSCLNSPNLTLVSAPFRICKISNFIKNESFMEELKNELSEVKSRRQSIDLYQFEQTSDLASVETSNLKNLYETFQTDVSSWMERCTTIKLNRKISMSSSCYYDTDYLLCHDDNMGDRRIAFVLYLSKNWTVEDGGSLDLFDTDDNGRPRNIVKSFVPEYNSLIFFEVVENSYHQVAEVTSSEKSRWTINGWFHGPAVPTKKPNRIETPQLFVKPENTIIDLNLWITETYINPEIIRDIQKNVEHNSYTFLGNFLKNEIYELLADQLTSETIEWTRVGPADVRNYEIADEKSLPDDLRKFYNLFKSMKIFQLLKDYTELDLVAGNDEASSSMDPKMTIELQRWSKGCYTLICDRPMGHESTTNFHDNRANSSPTPTSNGDGTSCASVKSRSEKNKRPTSLSSCENDETNDDDVVRCILRDDDTKNLEKSRMEKSSTTLNQASCSKISSTGSSSCLTKGGGPVNPDSEDSDVSDIGDYLSDPLDCSLECSEVEDDGDVDFCTESSVVEPGTLDVIMQFHTDRTTENDTIDYVDPREQEGALIHVPAKDNHLCIVYKTVGTTRLHKYVNHYCKGHFYNLICTYYE